VAELQFYAKNRDKTNTFNALDIYSIVIEEIE